MVNQISAFLTNIQNLTPKFQENNLLLDFLNRWLNETNRISLTDAERLLSQLSSSKFTASYICAAFACLIKSQSDIEISNLLHRLDESVYSFSTPQIQYINEIYCRFFQTLCDKILSRNLALNSIKLYRNALLKLTDNSTTLLTNLHAPFFYLCLKANRFDLALPFFRLNVTELFLSAAGQNVVLEQQKDQPTNSSSVNSLIGLPKVCTSSSSTENTSNSTVSLSNYQNVPKLSLDTRSILLYFYYASMILTALECYEDAFLMLEHVLCIPSTRASYIQVESLKKYLLIGLILGKTCILDSLPSYKSTIVQRQIIPACTIYTRFAEIVRKNIEKRKDVVEAAEWYIQLKLESFQHDDNYGLVKRVIIAAKENGIKRLGAVFLSLNLSEVSRLSFVGNEEETEQIARRLSFKNQYNVRIDQKTKTFRFDIEDQESKKMISEEQVENALTNIIQLRSVISDFDEAIALNHTYLMRQGKMGTRENLGLLYPEDEGFQANSLYSHSPPMG